MRVAFLLLAGLAALKAGAAPAGDLGFRRHVDPRFFPEDARQWKAYSHAVLITDLGAAEPQSALNTGLREKGRWKILPYRAEAGFSGKALSIYAASDAVPVRVPLGATGWHAVYVGVCTVSGGLTKPQKSGVRAKLAGAPVYRRMSNNLNFVATRRDVIEDQFLTVADLKPGDQVEFAPTHDLPATVAYIRLVPIGPDEIAAWRRDLRHSEHRTEVATNDGHSWIWPYRPRSAADLAEFFEGFQPNDFGQYWYCVVGADLVSYPSKVGTIPGEGTKVFPSPAYAEYTRSVQALIRNGVNPLLLARREAAKQGRQFHVFVRPAAFSASMPWDETFNSRFYREHPEWRCVDREGRQAMFMSYAVPEVRRHILDVIREAVTLSDPDGVGFFFNRGMPLMLWEKPFADQFKAEYGIDVMSVGAEDPRIHRLRAKIMTGFFRDLRAMLDQLAEAHPGRRYSISATVLAAKRFNDRFGLDTETWVKDGLIDQIGVVLAYYTQGAETFTRPDVAYFHRITQGTNVRVYPFILAWNPKVWTSGTPQGLCKLVDKWYDDGATGVGIWDPFTENGFGNDFAEGNQNDLLGYLGHRALVDYWARNGTPKPNAFPLVKLGENEYSSWFPNTGY